MVDEPLPAGARDDRPLPPAARRALEEAAARKAAQAAAADLPPEQGGRGGLDPTRFQDWEIKGRAIDFS